MNSLKFCRIAEKTKLIQWVTHLTINGYPSRHSLLREMAKELLKRHVRHINDDNIQLISYESIGKDWLSKANLPPITCDLIRPLSILSIFRRLFETLLLPVFINNSLYYCKLYPSQVDFRHGYFLLVQIIVCHHVNQSKRIKFVIFLDFKTMYLISLSQDHANSRDCADFNIHSYFLSICHQWYIPFSPSKSWS